MKRRHARVAKRAEALVLIIVLLAVIGGGCWYLISSRRNTEKQAWIYAREVAEHIALQHDARFVDLNLSSRAQLDLPPSWRERLFANLRDLGTPDRRIELTGKVEFTSYFFEPKGVFRAQIKFPSMPANLDMAVSPSRGPWQIDALNLTWHPAGY